MNKLSTTVSAAILISLLVITGVILTAFLLIVIVDQPPTIQSAAQHPRVTYSTEEMQRYLNFKEFLNVSADLPPSHTSSSSSNMKMYMRSIYQRIADPSAKSRYDANDLLIALPNQYIDHVSMYRFTYAGPLHSLVDIHLILPLTSLSTLRVISPMFDLTLVSPCQIDQSWCEINLTRYITSFPLTFHLDSSVEVISSGFLLLRFRPSSVDETALVTYPNEPQHCQVRPFQISFMKLRWSTWIVEPNSYSMNLCSGACHTGSNMATYTIIQNLLHQKHPKAISAPCCRPKRFASMHFLYYDGENLLLKKHSNMRVTECTCSL